ncbi:alpha/beta hydrolase [Arsenicibacter rosenii]|uniref:Endo-1,4-beta-xylanase n=1 Tax=Arsenicibacter rosenii TaxID=1750698 RepID=A0A1S2VNK5_9BACT|nr:alpha/beta hydrolase [Arsenicibacter rosenii]OIN60357.1 endo-1,4-beta-xylanase [Arsenicibacter rosenii]
MLSFKRVLTAGFLLAGIFFSLTGNAQQAIPLYPGAIPNNTDAPDEEVVNASQGVSKVSRPTLSIYLPPRDKATGAAVIVCPGGGYGTLVMKREGYDVAQALNELGIAAFVLKYRLPGDNTNKDKSIAPLQDAQQAISLVRQRAGEWGVNPAKIGIMGFSAGGHLASTAGTHFSKAYISHPDGISLRPDFMILVYPVISFSDSLGHKGSRERLLGTSPAKAQVDLFSNDLQVTTQTPPTFLLHAGDDTVVPIGNSLRFYEALLRHGVAAGMHIYPTGAHGFSKAPAKEDWFAQCRTWLKANSFTAP